MHDYFRTLKDSWENTYIKHGQNVPWTTEEFTNASVPIIKELINKNCPHAVSVIDYGTGTGHNAVMLEQLPNIKTVSAADITDKGIDRQQFKKHEIKFIQAALPNGIDGKYDVILCGGVFHSIDPKFHRDFLSQFRRLLNKNGIIILGAFDPKDEHLDGADVKKSSFSERNLFQTKIIYDDEELESIGLELVIKNDISIKTAKENRTFFYCCLKPMKKC